MICCPLAISRDIAGNISSASSIRPLPLSSAEVARGTASFAARGHSTDAITGWKTPKCAVEELAQIREPGIFIVDDVAFIQAEHGMQIAEGIARRGIRKRYYLETRGDVLLRNKEVFKLWKRLGLNTMFLGLEAIDDEGLKRYRKRVTLSKNFEALEYARSLDITVAVNIIADPSWDRERFKVVRDWCLEIPEVVNISINTPYPSTETWHTESRRLTTRDYRLFDIQHAVLPTKLPLAKFYKELVETQRVLSRKHLGWAAVRRNCCATLASWTNKFSANDLEI